MVVCGDPPDFWAVTGGAIGKADPAIMRTMSQLLMHDSSRGSEHGDWYRCAASESALVGHRLAQAQHPTLLQARIVINSRLNLTCNTGQRSRRKNSWVAWVLREATGQSRRTKEGERGTDSRGFSEGICSSVQSLGRVGGGFVALSHEPLGSDVNALQRLVVGDRNRRHCRERNAHGVQRR